MPTTDWLSKTYGLFAEHSKVTLNNFLCYIYDSFLHYSFHDVVTFDADHGVFAACS